MISHSVQFSLYIKTTITYHFTPTGMDIIIDSMAMSVGKLWEILNDREAWCATVHEVTKSRKQLSD